LTSHVIALRLGHEQTSTTDVYLHADTKIMKDALDKAGPPNVTQGTYARELTSSPGSTPSDYADNQPANPRFTRSHIVGVGMTEASA
jgi:hypothetical protein